MPIGELKLSLAHNMKVELFVKIYRLLIAHPNDQQHTMLTPGF